MIPGQEDLLIPWPSMWQLWPQHITSRQKVTLQSLDSSGQKRTRPAPNKAAQVCVVTS